MKHLRLIIANQTEELISIHKGLIKVLGFLAKLAFPTALYALLIGITRPLVKKINFLISQAKHMLWLLKRTVSMRRFEHPKHK